MTICTKCETAFSLVHTTQNTERTFSRYSIQKYDLIIQKTKHNFEPDQVILRRQGASAGVSIGGDILIHTLKLQREQPQAAPDGRSFSCLAIIRVKAPGETLLICNPGYSTQAVTHFPLAFSWKPQCTSVIMAKQVPYVHTGPTHRHTHTHVHTS